MQGSDVANTTYLLAAGLGLGDAQVPVSGAHLALLPNPRPGSLARHRVVLQLENEVGSIVNNGRVPALNTGLRHSVKACGGLWVGCVCVGVGEGAKREGGDESSEPGL